jgi:hypothetical protein
VIFPAIENWDGDELGKLMLIRRKTLFLRVLITKLKL